MSVIKDRELDEAKSRIDLLDYILKTVGGKAVYSGVDVKSGPYKRIDPCPICGKKGHFDVYENTNSYFSRSGCCKGGTIIDFICEYEGLKVNAAIDKIKELSGQNNTAIKKRDSSVTSPEKSDNEGIEALECNELINELHSNAINIDYFKNRGLTFTIEKYKLGYHPEGLNYLIKEGKGLFKENPNDLFKTFKYFIPCFDENNNCFGIVQRRDDNEPLPYWVNEKDPKKLKVRNLKGRPVYYLNQYYLTNPKLSKDFIFIVEGWADALSLEEVGYNAIALHSSSNASGLIKLVKKNKDLLKEKVFILSGDADGAGNKMNEALKKGFNKLKVKHHTYIIPQYGDLNEALVANREQFEQNIDEFIESIENIPSIEYEAPEVSFGDSIFEQGNCYFKKIKDGAKIIANFIIEPLELIESDKISELTTKLKTVTGMIISRRFTLEDFNTTSKFKKALNSIDLSFTGRDEDLEYIKSNMSRKPFDRKQGVSCAGFHFLDKEKKWVFVAGNKTIDSELNEVNNIVMLESYRELDTSLLDQSQITKEELLKITEALFKFNDLNKVATILGYASGLFLKEKLWQLGIKYNHLMIIGEAGSGKSQTVENILSPIIGLTCSAIGAAKCTPFSTMKTAASSNTIPFIIEEYKPGQIGTQRVKDISNLMRDVYDHHRGQRGRADQSIEYYDLCSPIVLVGEMGVDETAIKERSLQVMFSKMDIEDENRRSFFKLLKDNQELLNKLGRSLLNTSFSMKDEDLKSLHETCLNLVSPNVTVPRIKNSIANCMVGITLLNKVYKNLGIDIYKTTGISNKDIIEAINSAAFEDLLESNNSSRTVIDITLEVFARMADSKNLIEEVDYAIVNGDTLALNINRIYDTFNKYRAEHKLEDEYISQRQFTSQLRKTDYFSAYKAAKLCTDRTMRFKKNYKCFMLDIKKLRRKNLELDPLIGHEEEQDNFLECIDNNVVPFV